MGVRARRSDIGERWNFHRPRSFWLGPKIWASGREHGYLTQAQLFGDRFQSPGLRAVASVTGIVAMVPYISIQMIGAGYVFNITTGGRILFG
jgi:solute:Na+ symporter, SSS family